jgi:uncharacterized repeat protein (TIGR01451 family)
LKYSTYLGGSQDDFGRAIAVDSAGNAYVAGTTSSSDFVTPAGTQPFQASNNGGGDAFVAKIAAAGNALNYFSYLGGSGAETAYAIAVDANRGIHIAGSTTSNTNFPEVPTGIASFAGGTSDAFVAVIQTTTPGQSGGYSQTVGGAGDEDGTGVALDANANTYVAGETTSMNFPVASGQFTSRNGASDAFVAKIAPSIGGLTVTPTTSASSIGIGNQVTFTYTIKNTGTDVVNNLLFTDNLPASGATFVSAASTPGSCTAVVNGTVTCSLGSLAANAQAVVKIVLTPTVARPFNNSGTLQSNGVALVATSPTVTVNDFTLGVSPTSTTLTAGDTATYQVTLGIPAGQSGAFSNQVSLSCSAGVPTAAACTFSTNPLTMSNASPVSSTLTITTTARPVTTTSLPTLHRWYVSFLPITGLTLLGISIGGVRRRRFAVVAFAVVLFGLCGLQLACNNGSGTTQPKTGTPAGTYTITLTGTSGSASHAKQLKLVVQ